MSILTIVWGLAILCLARWLANYAVMRASPEKDSLEEKLVACVVLAVFSGLWLAKQYWPEL
jgi:Kef-type K+ transport system membrane component KefB